MKKIVLIYILVFFALLAPSLPALAQNARPLEVQYPPVPGLSSPITAVGTPLPDYVKYLFNFFVWGTGFVALIVLMIAGFRYMTSAGTPAILVDAKNQIFAALTGLLILFSSWLILNAINPQLTQLRIQAPPPVIPAILPGIYLCAEDTDQVIWAWEEIRNIRQIFSANPDDPAIPNRVQQTKDWLERVKANCLNLPSSGEIAPQLNDRAAFAYTVPADNNALYGAILYDESKFGGRAQVVYTLDARVGKFAVTAIRPSSARTLTLVQPRSQVYLELYETIDLNRADPGKESSRYSASGLASHYYTDDFNQIGSVKVEGNLIVIFFKDRYDDAWPEDALLDVVRQTDQNLFDNLMGGWCSSRLIFSKPCAGQMVIVSGGIY